MKLINLSLISGIDDSLINRIAKEDSKAFGELYIKTKKVVFSIAFSITKSPSDSEDITQEVFMRVMENAKNYQNNGKPLAWIYTITRNLAISNIRKNQNKIDINEIDNDIRFSSIEDPTDKLILKSALEILSEEELNIVLLHNSGVKHKEISQILEMPLSTILSKYNRSLAKMKNFLNER